MPLGPTLRATQSSPERSGAKAARSAGLPPIRLHDLRHGAASLALAAGADLKVVQDMLGHASIVLTADTYTSVLPEVARQAAEDTAALILAAGCLIPGTPLRRRPGWRSLRKPVHAAVTGGLSAAHPARQIARPRRRAPRPGRLSGRPPADSAEVNRAATRPANPGAWAMAIPRPTSAHTADPWSARKIA